MLIAQAHCYTSREHIAQQHHTAHCQLDIMQLFVMDSEFDYSLVCVFMPTMNEWISHVHILI